MIKYIYKKLLFPIFIFFRIKDKKIAAKIEEVIYSHELLIKEYELIKLHKSKLSANKRRAIKSQIIYLIAKGHIKINQ